MKYNYYQGLIKERISKLALLTIALLFAMTAAMGAIQPSMAASHLLDPFTQDELDDNWGPDRRFPTGGANSVEIFERDNVAQLAVTGSEQSDTLFQRTEGIKTEVGDFGQSVQVDLYLNPDWQDKSVATGLWVVGDDGDGARDDLFGILEFINLSFHTGWSYWESGVGYTDSNLPFEWGTWVTLKIELDVDTNQYTYSVDGEELGSVAGGENNIREVFLNTYNFGSSDYASHWHAGVEEAPEAPKNLTVVDSSGNAIEDGAWTNSFSITTSWDGVDGASSYEYSYWNDIPGSFTEANRWIVNNGESLSRSGVFNQGEGTHFIAVRAISSTGLESEWSETFTVGYDATPPEIKITDISNSPVTGTFNIEGTASDELSGLRQPLRIVFRPIADGSLQSPVLVLNPEYDDGNWSLTIDTKDYPELVDGEYRVVARANDMTGTGYGNSNTAFDRADIVIQNSPLLRNECMRGGWGDFGFRNQGQCIRFVNTGQDSR